MVEFNNFLGQEAWKLLEQSPDLKDIYDDVIKINRLLDSYTNILQWMDDANKLDKKLTVKHSEIAKLKAAVFTINQTANIIRGNNNGDGYDDFHRQRKILELDKWGLLAKALKEKDVIKEIGEIILGVL